MHPNKHLFTLSSRACFCFVFDRPSALEVQVRKFHPWRSGGSPRVHDIYLDTCKVFPPLLPISHSSLHILKAEARDRSSELTMFSPLVRLDARPYISSGGGEQCDATDLKPMKPQRDATRLRRGLSPTVAIVRPSTSRGEKHIS